LQRSQLYAKVLFYRNLQQAGTLPKLSPTKEVQVGYYHVRAINISEAIAIAKENPEFAYVASASIEIRPVKLKEEATNFIYPVNEK
jgi:hypothetical protein